MLTSDEEKIVGMISAEEAFAHIKFLSEIAPRTVGGPSDEKGINYFLEKFREYGLEAKTDPFKAFAFIEESAELSILEPEKFSPTTKALFGSLPTPADGIEGELVAVGSGTDEELEKKDINGKIVVVNNLPTAPKGALGLEVAKMKKKGAIGYVLTHYQPWPQILMLETGKYDPKERFPPDNELLPAVVIGSLDWHKIALLMEHGPVKAKVSVKAIREERETKNVHGIIKGTELPEKKVLVIAHRDGVANQASNDNGSGNAIILEIARVLAKVNPKRTIEFISLGGGEVLGCRGAWHYVEKYKDDLKNIEAVINIDAVALGGHLRIVTEGSWIDYGPIKTTEWLNKMLADAAKDLNYMIDYTPCMLGLADATPFLHHGVPACWLWKYDDPYWHSPLDTPENVDPNSLKVISEIVALTALRIANK